MKHANFFSVTQRFEDQIGATGSFIWASYGGLWKIFRDANQLNNKLTITNWREVEEYLLGDVPDARGVDLKEIALTKKWEDHQASYEQIVLVQASVLYEEWAMAFSKLAAPAHARASELLQFPSTMPRNNLRKNHPKTWQQLQTELNANPSTLIATDYQPELIRRYSTGDTDALLNWYRFFKECRNAYVHAGGCHTQSSIDAYSAAQGVSLRNAGMSRDFSCTVAPVVGDPIRLELSNAVLCLGIIGRLANSFDALLCHSKDAEADMLKRLTHAMNNDLRNRLPSSKANGRERFIKSMLRCAHLPIPSSLLATENFLKTHSLIHF